VLVAGPDALLLPKDALTTAMVTTPASTSEADALKSPLHGCSLPSWDERVSQGWRGRAEGSIEATIGLAGRVIAGRKAPRKVRTPQGRMLGKPQAAKADGKWHRKETASGEQSLRRRRW
jgi:hypothetical protein